MGVSHLNMRQSRRSANGPSGEVFPSSLKTKVTKPLTGTGGISKPPDRLHEDHSMELSRSESGSYNSPTGRNVSNVYSRFSLSMETKNDLHHLQNLQVSLGFDSLLTVELVGNSGGLALLF